MKTSKKLKGFTLVELIVVMAIFSILMIAVMQVINPLNKLSKRASIQEANAAAVDNIKNYLEGSLRYADCIQVCMGGLTDNSNKLFSEYSLSELNDTYSVETSGKTAEKAQIEAAVVNYIDSHYANRTTPGTDDPLKGKVRMLKIDNANGGKVYEYEWNFTAGFTYYDLYTVNTLLDDGEHKKGSLKGIERRNSKLVETPNSGEEVINPVYYEKYAFYITPGYNEMKTIFSDKDGTVSGISAKHESGDYEAALQPMDSTGLKLDMDYSLSSNLFTLSVVTYKNNKTTAEDGTVDYKYKGTLTSKIKNESDEEETVERVAFRSPFALTNTNMSLVNINSEFGKLKDKEGFPTNYGPFRLMGYYVTATPEVAEKNNLYVAPDGAVITNSEDELYVPEDKIEGENGKWFYEEITEAQAPKIYTRLDRHADVPADKSDDCIYFIYTLPEFK